MSGREEGHQRAPATSAAGASFATTITVAAIASVVPFWDDGETSAPAMVGFLGGRVCSVAGSARSAACCVGKRGAGAIPRFVAANAWPEADFPDPQSAAVACCTSGWAHTVLAVSSARDLSSHCYMGDELAAKMHVQSLVLRLWCSFQTWQLLHDAQQLCSAVAIGAAAPALRQSEEAPEAMSSGARGRRVTAPRHTE